MNTSLPANAVPSLDPYAEALRLNRDALDNDLSATKSILQETVQIQQQAQIGLMDRIALLETQLQEAQKKTARAEADLRAATVASAAMARQIASQQEELAQLRPSDALLNRMVTTVVELDRLGPKDWPVYNSVYSDMTPNTKAMCERLDREDRDNNFKQTGSYIPTPEHWGPILEDLKRARDLIASRGSNGPPPPAQANFPQSNPIPIQQRK